VIINGSAGSGHDPGQAEALRAAFARHGATATVTLAEDGQAMIATAKAALENGASLVVAGGGDGTINAIAAVLAGTKVAFGVLPLGTLNHFAKDLGIPLDLEGAVANVVNGERKMVDVGEVNGQVFLNNSSLGLYPNMVRDRDRQQRLGRGKWLAACWASIVVLTRYPFLQVRLKLEEGEHLRSTPFVFIGNNEYTMEGLNIGERTALDRGRLSLYVAQRPGRLGLLRFAWRALCGRLAQESDFDVLFGESIEVETGHKLLRVATDGEVTVMVTPLKYRIRPAALCVIVPS